MASFWTTKRGRGEKGRGSGEERRRIEEKQRRDV
jgi:hypothetical protein